MCFCYRAASERSGAYLIRRMTDEDVCAVAALEKACFSAPWSAQAFSDCLHRDEYIFACAVCGGKVCGYAGMITASDEADVTNIAVALEYRGHKAGTMLMEYLLSEAGKRGVSCVFLEVRRSNSAAIRLYENAGFFTVGERKNYYSAPEEDALIMKYLVTHKAV